MSSFIPTVSRPFDELDAERKRHQKTLNVLKDAIDAAVTRDGMSRPSGSICTLCVEIPNGKNLSFRKKCPLHNSRDYVIEELHRIAAGYRRPAKVPTDAATNPPTDA